MDLFTAQIREALIQPESFNKMWAIAKSFLENGYQREELLRQLENLRAHFRERNLEQEEDQVLELMDCFVGWCAPELQL